MNHEIFFENLEVLIDAPNGVQKLRELILQLAVHGKLVPQDPNDEPVSELLLKIKTEKENLIKKSDNFKPVKAEDALFSISNGWEWVRLSDVCPIITDGEHLTPEYSESGVLLLSAKHIGTNDLILGDVKYVSEEVAKRSWLRCKPEQGDILVVSRGGGVGRTIISKLSRFCLMGSVLLFKPSKYINNKFLYYFLKSTIGNERLIKSSGSTAQPAIYITHLKRNYILPLCPINEQNRIVAKIDQLMAHCDQLEARQLKKHEIRILLNNAALDKLLTAPTPEEFAHHWQRICDNFDLLYDAPETVGQLRQAILQLAVRGKLVAQDSGDEPAAVLLDRIMAEKRRLVKEKKIKKDIAFEPISEEEIDFKLPIGWVLCRVGEFTTIKGGKRLPNGAALTKVPTDHIYIRVSDMKKGAIDDYDLHYITDEVHEKIKNYIIEKDDLYLTIVGSTIGKLGIVPDKFHKMNLTENAARIIIYEIDKYFLNYSLNSHFIQNQFFDKTKQLGQPKLALKRIASTLFPLAPFEEQKRIVAKVEQLMALCDELEAELAQAQTDGGKLMEAVVHHVLAA